MKEKQTKKSSETVKLDKPKLDMSTVTPENILNLLAERSTLLAKLSEEKLKLTQPWIPSELTPQQFNWIVDKLNTAKIREPEKQVPNKLYIVE
jgi:hypothetical protein